MQRGKLLIAQGGGPTAVINQSLVGAVIQARHYGQVIGVYGAIHGVRGIIDEDFVDLGQETTANLELVAATPGSALGSTREKPDAAYCAAIFQVLKAHAIYWFFYIGGNDSSETLRIVHEFARQEGYPLQCIHIPKTIDNDLLHNDHTPGYPSAARFVAGAFAGADLDNRALPGVYVAVVMGRHAGFLTAAAASGRNRPDDGPHLLYLPERNFTMERFLAEVQQVHDRLGRCVVAVSEGIHDADGIPILNKLQAAVEQDAHGNVQLSGTGALADQLTLAVKRNLGIKRVRGDTFGYLQRSFLGVVSEVDQREAREVGEMASHFAFRPRVQGGLTSDNGTVTLKRVGDYAVDYRLEPLEAVAGKTRTMPDAFIHPDRSDITPAFQDYLRPLLGADPPRAWGLRAPRVTRILKP